MNTKEIENYRDLGKALLLSNDQFELIITLDVGPRILWFSLANGENILADNVDEKCELPDGQEWYLYGGHRVWHSPESFPRTYLCDSLPVEKFEVLNNEITIWQEKEPWTNLKKGMQIRLLENCVEVRNRIVNVGAWPVETAVWAITVVSKGGQAISPVVLTDTGLLPNACYVTWPYTRLNDNRVYWGEKYIILKNDPLQTTAFKFGYPNTAGWAAYINRELCFIKRYQHKNDVKYPDFGCSYECYTSDWGLEMETLSPLYTVKPGKIIEHSEYWQLKKYKGLIPEDETEVDKIMKALIDTEESLPQNTKPVPFSSF